MAGAALGFPFTWAQWKELERQATIYQYILASVPVPPHLLFPTTTNPSASHSLLGNGSVFNLNLVFSDKNEADQPGRCKRTDGKKWRCSRDVASPQHKYCERHLNRGRPRSRKHVEQLHHPSTAAATTNNKVTRLHRRALPSASLPKPLTTQSLLLQSPFPPNFTPDRGFDWTIGDESGALDLISYSNFRNNESDLFLNPDMICTEKQQSPKSFIDAWSNEESNSNTESRKENRSPVSSNESPSLSSLTISVAMAAGDALDEEMGQIQMGLGVGDSNRNKPHDSSLAGPVSWAGSTCTLGGPLGEVLRPSGFAVGSDPTSSC